MFASLGGRSYLLLPRTPDLLPSQDILLSPVVVKVLVTRNGCMLPFFFSLVLLISSGAHATGLLLHAAAWLRRALGALTFSS